MLHSVPDFPGQPAGRRLRLLGVLRTPGVRPVLLVIVAWVLAHNILYTYIAPFLAKVGLGASVDLALLVFGSAAVAGIWLVGALVDRHLRRMVLASLALFAVAALALCASLSGPCRADFDPGTDYGELMIEAAASGDGEAGLEAAAARNEKIDFFGLDEEKISYEDLALLAKVIHTEAGSAWLSMEWKMAVGEVLLNRVASPEFPDTLAGCAFQPGQYTAADEDWFEVLLPFRDCVEAAFRLLSGERVLNDPTVVFQSGGKQGSGVALELEDSIYGSVYFCYTSHPELYG